MSNLSVFSFNSNEVRTFADANGEPWFLVNDICKVLGYTNPSKTVKDHCKAKGITNRYTPTSGGDQEMTYINEGNLYRLIVKSRKPEAEAFEELVMEEILPTIRKTGSYSVKQPTEAQKALPDYRYILGRAVKKWVAIAQEHGSRMTHSEAWGIVHLRTGMLDGVETATNEQLIKGLDVVGQALEGILIPREQAQIAQQPTPEPTPQPVKVSDNALMIERMLHNVIPDQMKEVLDLLVKFNHHNMQLLSTFTQRSMMTA